MRLPQPTMLALCAFALALGACGSLHSVQDPDARADALSSARPAPVPARPAPTSARPTPPPPPLFASDASARSALAASVLAARRAYNRETKGSKLRQETARIAADATLLRALARDGSPAGGRGLGLTAMVCPIVGRGEATGQFRMHRGGSANENPFALARWRLAGA